MSKPGLFRTADGKNHLFTFILVCTLFFLWGFCNNILDTLNKHFQNSFHLSIFESGLVQFANYIGYFVMAIPSGLIAKRFGYKNGILTGLTLIAVGSFWFIPATQIGELWAFLLGLFIVATGLACLETIANPYTTVLGAEESSAKRINIAQICNSIAAVVAPLVAAWLILSATNTANTSNASLYVPYMIIGGMVVVLIIAFYFADVPEVQVAGGKFGKLDTTSSASPVQNQSYLYLNLGLAVLAQFLYVAAQVGLGAYTLNYARSSAVPLIDPSVVAYFPTTWGWFDLDPANVGFYHFTDRGGAGVVSVGLLGFFFGRIFGSTLISLYPAHLILGGFAVINTVLMALTVLSLGWISFFSLILSFFFMSIMFPTIFALGIRGLGSFAKIGASLIVMSIVGGALMPFAMGKLADISMHLCFIIPLACFAYIAVYAFLFPWLQKLATGHEVKD